MFKQGINLHKLSRAWIKINNKYTQIFAIQIAYEDKLKQPILVINYFFKLTKEEFEEELYNDAVRSGDVKFYTEP